MMLKKMIGMILVFVAATLLTVPAMAGNFPEKAVKIVVPFKPGGGSDVSARIFSKYVSKYLGKSVVVTNITGGSGKVGETTVMKTRPDGYTVLWQHQTLHMAYLTGRSTYNWNSFAPVCMPVTAYTGIFAPKNAPYKNMAELKKYVKANPGKFICGFSPLGNSHYAVLKMIAGAGLTAGDFKMLPMSGDKNRIVAMMQGNMGLTAITASSGRPYLESGDLKLIGLMSPQRLPGTDYPTLAEQGVAAVEAYGYTAWVPKGTPKERIKILADAFIRTAHDKEMAQEMEKLWLYPAFVKGDALIEMLSSDYEKYKELSKQFGILKVK